MKACIACSSMLPLEEFYAHPRMADKRLNKCKDCCRQYQKTRRVEHPEIVRAIDRKKAECSSRKRWRIDYQRKQRAADPLRYKARQSVSNALRDGRMIRMPCVVCGEQKSEAHHPDYSQSLNVVWVCFRHHRDIHKTECSVSA